MEKEQFNEPLRQPEFLEPDRKKSGFLKRWRKKLNQQFVEDEQQPVEVAPSHPEKSEESTSLAKVVLRKLFKQQAETDQAEPGAEAMPPSTEVEPEALVESAKKVGRKVLRFATGVANEIQELPAKEKVALSQATAELGASRQHLSEELEELQEVAGGYDGAATSSAPRRPAPAEAHAAPSVQESKKPEKEKKVSAFAAAQMALLALAGAGIFMVTVEETHLKDHRTLKKIVTPTLRRHRRQLKSQHEEIQQQQEVLALQTQELKELRRESLDDKKRKERAVFVHQVSEITEAQAEITHSIVENVRQETLHPQKVLEQAKEVVQVSEVARELVASPEKAQVAAAAAAETFGGGSGNTAAGFAPYHSPTALKDATELQKQTKLQNIQSKAKKPVRDAWLYAAIFTTMTIVAIGWLVVQLVING